MAEIDKDLASIQEARTLAVEAFEAWKIWSKASQEQVDEVCSAMAEAAFGAAERLGRMANEETGYGVAAHKKLKNQFAANGVWNSIKDIKTVGVVRVDEQKKIYEIAWPMGVIAALTPSTNPTSTVIFKILIAVKARDAIIIAPHPSAARCSFETAQLMAKVAEEHGAPKGLISCMQNISLQGVTGIDEP
jgi:acetaldehyde dehydrogenase (acetylating)